MARAVSIGLVTGEDSMVDQLNFSERMIGVAVMVAACAVGSGCTETKKAPDPDAAALKPSAQPAVADSPPTRPSAAPAPSATVGSMIRIPGGVFMMGSTDGQPDEKPEHRVQVTSFEMDVTEVTVGAYQLCIDSDKCTTPDLDQLCNWGRPGKEGHPMNCLDWDQASAYCASVAKRLPTEEEWEYAARGKEGRAYPWGNTPPPSDLCWARTRIGTCPADSVPVDSPFGLRGMGGNVWEWTSSGYSDDYGKKRLNERRVYRGGSFFEDKPEHMRATTRNRRPTNVRFDYLGFRCARSATKPAN
jgi:formylglycine-generating enzyme required for sulfatase activity